jgi:hypothetical protein
MAPIEWLNGLMEQRDGFFRLLEEAGGLPAAAWRLARARCQTWEVPPDVPSRGDVVAAARMIARRVGTTVPASAVLTAECEAMGLLVV